MHRKQPKTLGQTQWRLILGLLCIALVVLAGTLAVAHGHDDAAATHADCGLCAPAHVSLQLAVAIALIPVAQVFTRVEASIPPDRSRALSRFALFTRPPPVAALSLAAVSAA